MWIGCPVETGLEAVGTAVLIVLEGCVTTGADMYAGGSERGSEWQN